MKTEENISNKRIDKNQLRKWIAFVLVTIMLLQCITYPDFGRDTDAGTVCT